MNIISVSPAPVKKYRGGDPADIVRVAALFISDLQLPCPPASDPNNPDGGTELGVVGEADHPAGISEPMTWFRPKADQAGGGPDTCSCYVPTYYEGFWLEHLTDRTAGHIQACGPDATVW